MVTVLSHTPVNTVVHLKVEHVVLPEIIKILHYKNKAVKYAIYIY